MTELVTNQNQKDWSSITEATTQKWNEIHMYMRAKKLVFTQCLSATGNRHISGIIAKSRVENIWLEIINMPILLYA